jgi:ABC-type branched-subunit amino acid transport system ATPase component
MEQQGLKIKNVNKAVNGMKIIDNVTAAFIPGKITALIGPNGAGKTTLFHLITGELRADTGRITYRGEDVTFLSPYRIARAGIGRLFQDVRVFGNLTVYENVACACNDHRVETPWFPFFNWKAMKNHNNEVKEKVNYYLDYVGLISMKESQASALSYGQQKLLAIARLLARGFSLLLLDEPTAGLNTVMIKKVLGILEKIVKDDSSKTIVLVEHNMGVVTDVADWVYFMNEGRIAFFGRTDHVLGDKEVREIYLGL